ncbi:MAG TPA: NADH-quinone oxidoreductase subunit J, partial [Pseudomonas sp.]|nr:NADH-quinone oxidoreductase subunit J [Pseudomonas sp.]
LALGLLLHLPEPRLHAALWLFVLAHGLAKVSMFLAAGELQTILGSKRVKGMKGASQNVPIALAAFAVAGGSLVGLPPSGGFLAKWLLLQPLFEQPQHWPWALGVLFGTLMSAAYVFRVVAHGFDRARPNPPSIHPDRLAQWLALLPALLVWGLALISEPLLLWLGGLGR